MTRCCWRRGGWGLGFGCARLPPLGARWPAGCGPLFLPLRTSCCQKTRECVLVSSPRSNELAKRIDLCHERKRQDRFESDWPSMWLEPAESTRTRALFGSKHEKGCPRGISRRRSAAGNGKVGTGAWTCPTAALGARWPRGGALNGEMLLEMGVESSSSRPLGRPLERCRCLVRPGGRLRAAGYLARPGGPFHASRHSPCGNEKGSSFCSTLGERFRSPAA